MLSLGVKIQGPSLGQKERDEDPFLWHDLGLDSVANSQLWCLRVLQKEWLKVA